MNELYKKRNELLRKSMTLSSLQFHINGEQSIRTKKNQDKFYKKYKFYDNYLKAKDKVEKWIV